MEARPPETGRGAVKFIILTDCRQLNNDFPICKISEKSSVDYPQRFSKQKKVKRILVLVHFVNWSKRVI